jgi:cell division protein ZapA
MAVFRGSLRPKMAGRTVHVRVGGQSYRVLTSASDDELTHLAELVDQKIAAVVPAGRAVTPQAMLLAAMALAHDLEAERARSDAISKKARGVYTRLFDQVEAALEGSGDGPSGRDAGLPHVGAPWTLDPTES